MDFSELQISEKFINGCPDLQGVESLASEVRTAARPPREQLLRRKLQEKWSQVAKSYLLKEVLREAAKWKLVYGIDPA